MLGQRAEHQVNALFVRAGPHVGTEELDPFCDLGAALSSRAFTEHLRDEIREALLAAWVRLGARADHQPQVYDRELVRLDHVELEPVLEGDPLDGREVDVARRTRGRRGHCGSGRCLPLVGDGALLEGRHFALRQ